MLELKNIHALIDEKPVIKGLSLSIRDGEIHVIMGPNGAGKTSFSRIIMGDSSYKITSGAIFCESENINSLTPFERFKKGIMVTFQSPVEIPGVSFSEFLYEAYIQQKKENKISLKDFREKLFVLCDSLELNKEIIDRHINVGFSGGEKKRLEMLQVALFKPKYAVLDEVDSGLDIDGIRAIARMIKSLRSTQNSLIIITHDDKIISNIKYDYIHVLINGAIVESGGRNLGEKILADGYAPYGIVQTISAGT
jgi:Fe-S cluster assembly ATP-binding protein